MPVSYEEWIIALVVVFAIAPSGVLALFGLRWWFNRRNFGRVYVWDRPWSVVSPDARVHEPFGRFRLAVLLVLVMMLAAVGALVVLV